MKKTLSAQKSSVVQPLPTSIAPEEDEEEENTDHTAAESHDEMMWDEQARKTAQRYGTFKHPEDFDPVLLKPCKSDEVFTV